MKHRLLILLAGSLALAGCSSDNKASAPATTSVSPTVAPATATSAPVPAVASGPASSGETKVVIGGQPQNVSGPVVCSTTAGRFSIAVGDMVTGIIVGLEQDGSAVHSAGLGTVDGVVLAFTEGAPGNTATATKTGNFYKITGTATGVDNAGTQVSKPFEVEVTCP